MVAHRGAREPSEFVPMGIMQVQVPHGVAPGASLTVQTPDGQQLQCVVPEGTYPGSMFQIQTPEAEVPMGEAVAQHLPVAQPMAPPTVPIAVPIAPPIATPYMQPVAMPTNALVAQHVQYVVPPVLQQVVVAPTNQVVVRNEDVAIQTSRAEQRQRMLPDSIDESQLTLLNGLCCCNTSLLMSMACFGFAAKVGLLCLEVEACLKCDTPCLECGCCAIRCVDGPTACLKGQTQVCCLVSSVAIPTDDEVPCTLALCGWACYPQCGCCDTLGVLTRETMVVTQQVVVGPGAQLYSGYQ